MTVTEQNIYVGGIGTTLASHFKFTGQATIRQGCLCIVLISIHSRAQS